MEYVAGVSLQERLDASGPLELKEILRIGVQTAFGLVAAHGQGLIHRDIKPANILLENGVERVKITDFGLARAVDDASLTQSGVIAGTPQYMAPEQATGEAVDHRADLFSLGSVLYALCTGRAPFQASGTMGILKRVCENTPQPIREINPEIPDWLVAIIVKLHAKEPAERFQSAAEVADLMGRHLAHLQHPSLVSLPPFAPLVRGRTRRGRRGAIAAAIFLCLLAGLSLTEATGVTNLRATVIRIFTPEGTPVVGADDPGVKAPDHPAKADDPGVKDPDRHAAEWVLSIGGTISILLDRDKNEFKTFEIKTLRDLPSRAFQLKAVQLRSKSQVSDAGLANFKDCKELEHLILAGTKVSDGGLANFKDCKKLIDLDLSDTKVGNAGLANFKDCKELEYLILSSTKVSDGGLANFKDCKNLGILDLSSTKVSDVGLANFKDCKSFTGLILTGTKVSDAWLAHLKDCNNLELLGLGDTKVGDAGLAHLKDCNNLVSLILTGTEVSDAGLAHLKDCNNLTGLNLQMTKVTAAGIDELKKALPKCKVIWDGYVAEPKANVLPDRRAVKYVLCIGGTLRVWNTSARLPGYDTFL
jgi:hypothetical protein